jgi:hypothetical protein
MFKKLMLSISKLLLGDLEDKYLSEVKCEIVKQYIMRSF